MKTPDPRGFAPASPMAAFCSAQRALTRDAFFDKNPHWSWQPPVAQKRPTARKVLAPAWLLAAL